MYLISKELAHTKIYGDKIRQNEEKIQNFLILFGRGEYLPVQAEGLACLYHLKTY